VFCGTLDPDDVAMAMASSDVFVFPSRTDTAGNVVLEAQASGVPVLVSQIGGPHENMVPGHPGFVCRDSIEFVRTAAGLVRSLGRRRQLGERARDYALTRTWDTALEPLYRCYLGYRHDTNAASVGTPAAAVL
jgi:glycosyltransferase involved in cell wall biosynthesis